MQPEPYEWSENMTPCPAKAKQAQTEIGRFIVGPICNDTMPCPKDGQEVVPEPFVVSECFHEVTSQ